MTAFNETPVYLAFVSRLDAEIEDLTQQRDRLRFNRRAGVELSRKRTPEEDRTFTNLGGRIRRLKSRRDNATDLNQYSWAELLELWEAAYDRTWTTEERALLDQELESFEGRGEKPLRRRFGLPMEVSRDSFDLPGGEEVKYVGPLADPIRIGKVGKRAYVGVLRGLPDELIAEEMWDGEVSQSRVFHGLPEEVRKSLQLNLTADRVLSCYSTIHLTTETGYSTVPKADYAVAFTLVCITQYGPKYRLKREYVERKLAETLAQVVAKNPADVAA